VGNGIVVLFYWKWKLGASGHHYVLENSPVIADRVFAFDLHG
jgi:hypothetical protein